MKFQVAAAKRPLLAVSTLTMAGNEVFFYSGGGKVAGEASKREVHFRKSDGVYVSGVLMAPGRGAGSPAQPASTGGAG
eukprot:9309124-Alexandrium_andersonii.AAC.1